MRGIGVVQDGYPFSWAELERGTPRFWWGPAKRAAFDRALARHGMSRKEHDRDEAARDDDRDRNRDRAVGAGIATAAFEAKQGEAGAGWETKDNAASAPDSGGSSDGGGSDGGGGGSGA